jgi:hypothetical protein
MTDLSPTDFRTLCAELMNEAIYLGELPYEQDVHPELLTRARAALAQPEIAPDGPAVPDGREPASVAYQPTDEELLEIATQQWGSFHGSAQWPGAEHVVEVSRSDLVSFARAILAKWGP